MNARTVLIAGTLLLLTLFYSRHQNVTLDPAFQNDDNRSSLAAYMPVYGYKQFEGDEISKAVYLTRPLGHRWAYRALSYFTDLPSAPKILQWVLTFLLFWTAYLVGSTYLGPAGGLFSVMMVMSAQWIMRYFAGALPRSFGIVLYLAVLLSLVRGWRMLLLATPVLGMLFYPIVGLFSMSCFLINECVDVLKKGPGAYIKQNRKLVVLFPAALLIAAGIAFSYKHAMIRAGLGSPYTLKEAVNNPQFYTGGRLFIKQPVSHCMKGLARHFGQDKKFVAWEHPDRETSFVPKIFFSNNRKALNFFHRVYRWNRDRGDPLGFFIYLLLPAVLLAARRMVLPRGMLVFALTSLACYLLASAVAFRLYEPQRYLRYSFPILLCVLYPVGLGYAKHAPASGAAPLRRAALYGVLILVLAARVLQTGGGLDDNRNLQLMLRESEKPLHEFILKHTPATALLAGDLFDMDNIPLYAKRRILLSFETSIVWLKGFDQKIIRPRTKAICEAYFARDAGPLIYLRDRLKVDYFLVRKPLLRSDKYPEGYAFSPFNDLGKKLFSDNWGCFILLNPPPDAVVYDDPVFSLIDLGIWGIWGQDKTLDKNGL